MVRPVKVADRALAATSNDLNPLFSELYEED